jgi:DNA-binding NarL/FixJ family response regulator
MHDTVARRRPGLITVVLADDHQVMRQGLKSLFEKETDFQVIGEASDGIETMRLVESLLPNVLILDLMMEGINGLEVTRQLCERCPQTNIVILSTQSNEAYVAVALRAGAKGYVLKESSFEELVTAIRKAATGQHFLSLSLSERVIEAYLRKRDLPTDPYETLTTREREVLLLAAHGQSNAKIAEKLVISRRTVEVHRAKMMHKLNLNNQIELVRYALQRGILG